MLPQILSAIRDAPGLWVGLAALGAYHGLNPGMGWLFALARGLQQENERAIWTSLLPIAIGHAASLALVAGVVLAAGLVLPPDALRTAGALGLLAFGVYKLLNYYRHPRWVGMRIGAPDLCRWSFLVATAHGAGLMAMPLLIGISAACGPGPRPTSTALSLGSLLHGAAHPQVGYHVANVFITPPAAPAVLALAISDHTLMMLLTMGAVAWVVYKKVGLAFLRRGWINLDLIWAVALVLAGGLALII
jgi:hypothetical protein